jgi:hypothetical protein
VAPASAPNLFAMAVPQARGSRTPSERPALHQRILALARVDFPADHVVPRPALWVVASFISVVGSLGVDALLVAIGTSVFPTTKGYVHFRFSDYGKLTVVGVVVACLAWPVITWISSSPRWLFLRLAIAVTLVLWLPDLWILKQGQPVKAVAVLMSMHLGIAVVTYGALVLVAAPRGRRTAPTDG